MIKACIYYNIVNEKMANKTVERTGFTPLRYVNPAAHLIEPRG